MKILLFSVASVIFLIMASLAQTSYSQYIETCENSKQQKEFIPIDLEYEIDGGSILQICKVVKNIEVVAIVDAYDDGKFTINIPKKLVYSLTGTKCEQGSPIIFDNGKEIALIKTSSTESANILTVGFTKGKHNISFIGTMIIPGITPDQYCGVVMGFDSLYLPPKFQIEKGMKPEQVRCNEGLVLIIKSSDIPTCVKPETKQKLMERGWAKDESVLSSAESKYDPYNTRCSFGVIPAISENWQSFGIRPSDKDWETSGKYIIRQKFYQELKNRDIIFEPACLGVYTGTVEESYPPRFAMCSTVTASNGTQLYLEGTVNEFDITYFDIDNKMPYQCDDHYSGCLCQLE